MENAPDLLSYWHDLINHHAHSGLDDDYSNAHDVQSLLDSLSHLPESTLELIQSKVDQGMDIINVVNTLNLSDFGVNQSLGIAFGDSQDLQVGSLVGGGLSNAFGTLAELGLDVGKSSASVMESAQSTITSEPSITIRSDGFVWRHDADGDNHHVGYVSDGSFRNLSGKEVGYVDHGTFYTDHYMLKEYGCVHGGIIFNHDGKQIGTADTDLEGHAYLAFVVRGGMP